MSATIFETLPGMEVPVSTLATELARLWETGSEKGEAPSEFRASQMNLILHFGLDAKAGEAAEQFQSALRFAQRYPCRILVLCPEDRSNEELLLASKIFAECYVGSTRREMSCCEALILAYPLEGKDFLENQVSILLESDLPVYYWFHRFCDRARIDDLDYILETSRRVVFDTSVERPGTMDYEWPRPEKLRDLVYARLLPLRQSIGQFLSSWPPERLVDGLLEVETAHSPGLGAEADALLSWLRSSLERCADVAGGNTLEVRFERRELKSKAPKRLKITWKYRDKRFFNWSLDVDTEQGCIEADLGRGRLRLPMHTGFSSPEAALAEALFF